MTNLDIIKKLKAATYRDEEGEEYTLDFMPALTEEELTKLDARFPSGKVPAELREILKETRGWDGLWIERIYFDNIDEFGFEELIPYSVALGTDGSGNYWVLELKEDGSLGKIFYACHDPAVLLVFCETINDYLLIMEEYYKDPLQNYLVQVHTSGSLDIWKKDPNTIDIVEFRQNNPSLGSFLSEFDDNWVVADLRKAGLKDGFAWGKYGGTEFTKRMGSELLWVMQKKNKKKGFLSRLLG